MGNRYRRFDCTIAVALVFVLAGVAMPAGAQAPTTGPSLDFTSPPPDQRPSVMIGGTQPAATTYERCVDVEIGGERSLGCLNQKLRREVDRVNPSINAPPFDARSPDVAVGNVNEAAIREQYGANYGRSVVPYRPPPPTINLHR